MDVIPTKERGDVGRTELIAAARSGPDRTTALLRYRMSPNGVFGLKLDRDQFAFLQLLALERPL